MLLHPEGPELLAPCTHAANPAHGTRGAFLESTRTCARARTATVFCKQVRNKPLVLIRQNLPQHCCCLLGELQGSTFPCPLELLPAAGTACGASPVLSLLQHREDTLLSEHDRGHLDVWVSLEVRRNRDLSRDVPPPAQFRSLRPLVSRGVTQSACFPRQCAGPPAALELPTRFTNNNPASPRKRVSRQLPAGEGPCWRRGADPPGCSEAHVRMPCSSPPWLAEMSPLVWGPFPDAGPSGRRSLCRTGCPGQGSAVLKGANVL